MARQYSLDLIPDVPLHRFIWENKNISPDKVAIIDGIEGRKYTRSQLRQAILRFSYGLQQLGVKKGDIVALSSPNVPEYAIFLFSIMSVGAKATTLNPVYTEDELIYALNYTGAKYIITADLSKALSIKSKTKLEKIITLGPVDGAPPNVFTFQSLLTMGNGKEKEIEKIINDITFDNKNDIAVLPFSSGTTGFPKAVMLTHRNIVSNLIQVDLVDKGSENDVPVAVLPFFHIYGMIVILANYIHRGCTIVTLPRFQLETFLNAIQTYRCTHAFSVPPILLMMNKSPIVKNYDLSSLSHVGSGAAPLSAEVQAEFEKKFPTSLVRQGYGLTETSPVAMNFPPKREVLRTGSVGKLMPFMECKIVCPETQKVLTGPNQQFKRGVRFG
eukprot:TRINITY_DN1311_c0_g3_i2.p1 TRINITY_DN1311_c0_g3~~TRINITY_DN1311_c0_g3_i2.p1  ORF type:complete len:386 (-),score=51.61 TRINITY_DN1311_c0_g3_i2:491-1648(-)